MFVKIQLLAMYFTDANHLQTHLNNDWTVLLKNIKSRQDCHLQLLQYNRKIVMKQRLEQDLFINDQILQHHQQINKITEINLAFDQEERNILEKYEGNTASYEDIIKLMTRVGARVLQTYQSSIDKCKSFDEELVEKHQKMKAILVKLLNQKGQINLQEVTNLVISYSKAKLVNELQRLKKIVAALQNGQFSKLQEMYQYKAKKPVQLSIQKKLNISLQKAKITSLGRQQRSPLREQIKKQERIKKQKQKLAVKLANGLYSTMQLSKQQLIEDLSINEKGSDRLYTEIFIRNKSNYQQIKQFEAKRDQFNEKVRLFKEMMQRESQRITELLFPKPKPNPMNIPKVFDKPSENAQTNEARNEELLLIEQMVTQQQNPQKRALNRYRIQSPKQKRQWRQLLSNNTSFIQQRNDQFNHFKFDTKNQQVYARTNRNKLPLINNMNTSQTVSRTSSVDQRLQFNKTKILRHHQNSEIKETRQEMDNEEKGMKEKEEKYIAHKAKAIKNIDINNNGYIGRDRKRIQPSPMQYTFYVRKSTKKLHQIKLNALL